MLNCLFCKRKRRLYNIYKIYGATERPIKDYIVSFLGSVEEYLREDQGICDACVIILNKLIYIRNAIYQTIITHKSYNSDSMHIKFAAVYKVFLHNLDKLNFEDSEVEENVADLLRPTHTSPYTDYESEHEGRASALSRTSKSDRSSTPYVDREVASVFKKRRTRARTTSQNASVKSRAGKEKERSKSEVKDRSKKLYDSSGCLIPKRTRSVSRLQQSENSTTYSCENCGRGTFKTLEELTEHKIQDHQMLAMFKCCEVSLKFRCFKAKFTTQEDLERHNQQYHAKLVTNCPLCSETMLTKEELKQHLAEHRLHSVPCNYCDKFFLTGRARFQHIQENHKNAKKQIRHHTFEQSSAIIDRIDRSPLSTDMGTPTDDSVHEFAVKVMIQEKKQHKGAGEGGPEVNEVEDGRVGEDLAKDGQNLNDCEDMSEDSQDMGEHQGMEYDQSMDENTEDHQSIEDHHIGDTHISDMHQTTNDHQPTEGEDESMEEVIENHRSTESKTVENGRVGENLLDYIHALEHQKNRDFQEELSDDDQNLLVVHSEDCQSMENFDTGQGEEEVSIMDGMDVIEETILETSEVSATSLTSKDWTAYPMIEKERYAMDIIESSPEGATSHIGSNIVPISNSLPRTELRVVLDRLNSRQLAKLNNHVTPSLRSRRGRGRGRSRNSELVVDVIQNCEVNSEVSVKPKRTTDSPVPFNSGRSSRRLSYKLTNHESRTGVNDNSEH